MDPYVKNYQVYICPQAPDYTPEGYPCASGNTSCNGSLGGYGWTGGFDMNVNIGGVFTASTTYPVKTIAELNNSAGTFLIAETAQLASSGAKNVFTSSDNYVPTNWLPYQSTPANYMTMPLSGWNPSDKSVPSGFPFYSCVAPAGTPTPLLVASGNCQRRPVPRHNGGLNLVFCDGHAKWMQIDAFLGVTPTQTAGWPYGDPRNLWDDQ